MADMQSVKDDIAFMRALAAEGRSAPLLGGSVMMAAGFVFGGASIAHYFIEVSGASPTPWVYPGLWLGAGVLFMAILFALKARYRGRPGSLSPGNRAMAAVWQGVGYAIFTMFFAMGVAAWTFGEPIVFGLFPSVILALYGAAWTLAAQMSEYGWMRAIAALSFVSAVAVAFLLKSPAIYLAYAAALLLTAALPGWLLMRQEPSDVV